MHMARQIDVWGEGGMEAEGDDTDGYFSCLAIFGDVSRLSSQKTSSLPSPD